jgi:1-acyl-sn-glycerol-3-phosphate acyltransferase
MWPERAKTGAVRLALRSGVPIVPVAMVGAHEVIGRRRIVRNLLKNLVRRPKVRVAVGQPIDVAALIGYEDAPSPRSIRIAADAVMTQLVALVADLRGEQPEHPSGIPAGRLEVVEP